MKREFLMAALTHSHAADCVWILSYHITHSRVSRAANCFQVNKAFQTRDFIKTEIFLNNDADCGLGIVEFLVLRFSFCCFIFPPLKRNTRDRERTVKENGFSLVVKRPFQQQGCCGYVENAAAV